MKKVLFLDGTEAYSPHRIKEKPCGGIVTSLTNIPRNLVKMGWDVTIASGYQKEEVVEGVRHVTKFGDYRPDIVVFNRNVLSHSLLERFRGAKTVWWLHDIVDHRYLEDDAFRKINKIVSLSDYCTSSYSDFYEIDPCRFVKIQNGVDKKIFHNERRRQDKNLFICASAPIKGLYPIEFTFLNMRRVNPSFELRLYASQKLHDIDNTKQIDAQLTHLKNIGVTVLDPIPQAELADVMRSARCLLMPNHYPEICSNVLLQALSCGLPVVGVDIGSAREFIKDGVNGFLTKTFPHDMYWWWKDFAGLVGKIMTDDRSFSILSQEAPRSVVGLDPISKMWDKLLRGL